MGLALTVPFVLGYDLIMNGRGSTQMSSCYTEDQINDMLMVATIAYERCLESTGYVRSALYLEPMMNQLRDGDNSVILRMIKCFSGFAPFISRNYPELIDIIIDNIGPIQSTIH